MPTADWGISAKQLKKFDRSKQFKPYTGKTPPDGVYRMRLRKLVYAAGTKSKLAQVRPGFVLVPRDSSEKRYDGYYITAFMPVSEATMFRYVPFLDAIGVSEEAFASKTKTDKDGNILRIGNWKFSDEEELLVQLQTELDQKGVPRQNVKWVGALEETDDEDADEDADEDEDDTEDEDEDDDD